MKKTIIKWAADVGLRAHNIHRGADTGMTIIFLLGQKLNLWSINVEQQSRKYRQVHEVNLGKKNSVVIDFFRLKTWTPNDNLCSAVKSGLQARPYQI